VSTLSTHVLDAVTGRPAAGVAVRLLDASGAPVAEGTTDDDGRVRRLTLDPLPPGTYRLDFRTGDWFAARGVAAFYPEVVVAFSVDAEGTHLHVPLLLSPFAYSTYRGS
jgi:5-hydroxyisourate hydrolase